MPKDRDDLINQATDDIQRLLRRVQELEQQLADAVNGRFPEQESLDPSCLWVESIVAQNGDAFEPRVNLRWFTHFAQLDQQEARRLAFNILEACESSVSDAFLGDFCRSIFGVKDDLVPGLIFEFRKYRETREAMNGKA